MVGQASFHTVLAIGPSTMERSKLRAGEGDMDLHDTAIATPGPPEAEWV